MVRLMTESDFDAQIAGNRQAVAGFQQEIRQLEEQISELNSLKRDVLNMQDILHDTASRVESRVSGMTLLGGAVAAATLNINFFSKILGAARGQEYAAADNGLGMSQEIIQDKIDQLVNAIAEKQLAISSCNAKVSALQGEKAQYIQTKALEEAAAAGNGGA